MKKRINFNSSKSRKKVITYVIVIIFLIYFSLIFTVSERKYLYVEKIFKSLSSGINSFFINNAYSNNTISDNVKDSKIKYLESENNKLREMLDLKKENENYVFCEVVNHTFKTWFNKVEINAGYDRGIENGLPVINQEGLVGFISKTSKNVSEVNLLTNVSDSNLISVFIETDNGSIAGMLSGYDAKKDLFKVTDVISKNEIKAGDKVVLSGYDNKSYKGIYLGNVVKEKQENYGLSKTIWVESNVNFDDLMFVLVPVLKEEK